MRPARFAPGGGVLSYFARHRTLSNLIFVFFILLGLAALPNMRTQFFPDVSVDHINISANWPGASAEDVDRAIVQVIEPVLFTVDGVSSVRATSSEASVRINVEFQPDWDLARALDDVNSAIDTVTDLPEDIDELRVDWRRWSDRVTDVVISGPVDPVQIGQFADELLLRLYAVGIAQVELEGMAPPLLRVEVPSMSLISHDITMQQIADRIASEIDGRAAGDVDAANLRVRAGSEARTPGNIERLVLRSNPDGSKLTLGDVARVYKLSPDREESFFVEGMPAMLLSIDRSIQGDAITIQRQVEEVAAELQATLPEGVQVELVRTRAEAISARLDILLDNALLGLSLVLGLLFLFLNARTAFWVAAGIPVALLTAIAIMYAAGLTLNMISLFGLIITLGIVVDDAIVVAEHADHRARHLGEGPYEAAERAAKKMALPVFAATTTTAIAFSALVVVDGWYGRLVQDIPLAVVAVLVASLVECFLILPNHMAHAIAADAKARWYDWPSRQVNKGFRWFRKQVFRPFMAGVVAGRYVVIAGVLLALASQVAVFIRGDVNWRFFNAPERSVITGHFVMVDSATRDDSIEMMVAMEETAKRVASEFELEHGRNPIQFVYTKVGGEMGRGLAGGDSKEADLLGGIRIELIDAEERPYSSFDFLNALQSQVEKHPLAETVSYRRLGFGRGEDNLSIRLSGGDADVLKAASLAVQDALGRYPEVGALRDSLDYDRNEAILTLTPQGDALGFEIEEVGRTLRHRLDGLEAATFPDALRSAEIRVELPEEELTADFLEGMLMRSPDGTYAPLADIVSVDYRTGFRSVVRLNGVRVVDVTGEISEEDPARATEIEDTLRNTILPQIAGTYQLDWEMAGMAEDERTFLSGASIGFILCLIAIYVVLAWVFSSWSRPFVVLAIVPFGLVGTIYGHAAWDIPLSMFTVVGLLGMTGIIINDSIVLVSTIDDYAQDRSFVASIIDGAADRLRPVVLTTLTTVLGMMPLLYETSQQAQFLKPTVITLVYGLGFGLILVLLVVPALLAIQHDWRRLVSSARRGLRFREPVLRRAFLCMSGLLLVWSGLTLGWVAATGTLWPPLVQVLPGLVSIKAMSLALTLFVAGAAVLCFAGYVILTVLMSRRLPA